MNFRAAVIEAFTKQTVFCNTSCATFGKSFAQKIFHFIFVATMNDFLILDFLKAEGSFVGR